MQRSRTSAPSATRAGLAVAIFAAVITVAIGGCAGSGSEPSAGSEKTSVNASADEDFEALVDSMRIRNQLVDRGSWFKNLDEAYPGSGVTGSQTEVVVVGNVVGASEGRAFVSIDNPAEGESDSLEVDWTDPSATWRTVHLRVKVKEVLGGQVPEVQEIQVGIVISGVETDTAVRALKRLGRVGLFLGRSPVFGYDNSVYWVVGDGALLAMPANGKYQLPFLDPVTDTGLLGEPRLSGAINTP